jgi:hypothetical protein
MTNVWCPSVTSDQLSPMSGQDEQLRIERNKLWTPSRCAATVSTLRRHISDGEVAQPQNERPESARRSFVWRRTRRSASVTEGIHSRVPLTAYPLCVTRYADLGARYDRCVGAQLSDREPSGAKVCRTSHRRNNPRRARRGSDHVRNRSTRLCEDVLYGHRRFDL